jgi:hypothetical protein
MRPFLDARASGMLVLNVSKSALNRLGEPIFFPPFFFPQRGEMFGSSEKQEDNDEDINIPLKPSKRGAKYNSSRGTEGRLNGTALTVLPKYFFHFNTLHRIESHILVSIVCPVC